ncbi:MAG: FtsB family cell division protein [Bacteroidales bacterium]
MKFKEWAFIRFSKRFAKYIIATLLFGFLMIYWDDNNLIYRFKLDNRIHQLRGDIEHYNGIVKESSQQLDQLRNDGEKLERFARENYLMKKKDEDIFIVEEPKKDETSTTNKN